MSGKGKSAMSGVHPGMIKKCLQIENPSPFPHCSNEIPGLAEAAPTPPPRGLPNASLGLNFNSHVSLHPYYKPCPLPPMAPTSPSLFNDSGGGGGGGGGNMWLFLFFVILKVSLEV